MIASVSAIHHSPNHRKRSKFRDHNRTKISTTTTNKATTHGHFHILRSAVHVAWPGLAATTLTEDDGDLLVRRRERVGHTELGQDDDGAVDGGAQPGDVRVPPQRAALPRDGEVVDVALPRRDRALRDVRRSVRPPRPQLPDAVPAMSEKTTGDRACSSINSIEFRRRSTLVHAN
jgi:hypothetical protein